MEFKSPCGINCRLEQFTALSDFKELSEARGRLSALESKSDNKDLLEIYFVSCGIRLNGTEKELKGDTQRLSIKNSIQGIWLLIFYATNNLIYNVS